MVDLLKGLKVVEISRYMMGPICARILAEWGADVIKVEPLTGDPQRTSPWSQGVMNGDTSIWQVTGGTRRYVALDTQKPEGVGVLKKMVSTADVVISSMIPEAAKKHGLDYESLKKVKSDIILATASGYGTTGPDAGRPGYDGCSYAARAGFIADQRVPGSVPWNPFPGVGDIAAGSIMACAILAAYIKRQSTGVGESITSSLMGTGMFVGSYPICAGKSGTKPYPTPRDAVIPVCLPYECSDGGFIQMMGSIWAYNFEGWPKVFGDALPADFKERWPDYMTCLTNPEARTSMREFFETEFKKHDRDYWTAKLKETRIPFDPCLHFAELQEDKHAWEAGFFYKTECPGFDTGIPIVPAQFVNAGTAEIHDGKIGQDTRTVLSEYGYSQGEIDSMLEAQLIKE